MPQVRVLGATKQMGIEITPEQEELIKQGLLTLSQISGDKCKRGCDFSFFFNKARRQECKCRCAAANADTFPPPGVDCEAQFGISVNPVLGGGLGTGTGTGTGVSTTGGIKTNDLLIYGGIGLAAILLLRPKGK